MVFEQWHFYAISFIVAIFAGFLLLPRPLYFCLSAVLGWLAINIVSCSALGAPKTDVEANRWAEEFAWSIVFLPGCLIFGILGALLFDLIKKKLKRS